MHTKSTATSRSTKASRGEIMRRDMTKCLRMIMARGSFFRGLISGLRLIQHSVTLLVERRKFVEHRKSFIHYGLETFRDCQNRKLYELHSKARTQNVNLSDMIIHIKVNIKRFSKLAESYLIQLFVVETCKWMKQIERNCFETWRESNLRDFLLPPHFPLCLTSSSIVECFTLLLQPLSAFGIAKHTSRHLRGS